MRLADYVIQYLVNEGVRYVFTLPGGGSMYLVDALGRNEDIQYVCCLHEQACSIAADTYAQYTNHLGVAIVTTGPGGTNAITGVASSWIESSPALFISGQVPTTDLIDGRKLRQSGMQELNIIDIVRPITKYAECVTDAITIKYHLAWAIHYATTGRPGPVWLDIPLDVQNAEIDEKDLDSFGIYMPKPELSSVPLPYTRSILSMLEKAHRPVILAGNGIRLSGALDDFYTLVRKLKIPVLVTWKCIDFFGEEDQFYAGRPGILGSRYANFIQQNADLVIVLGARLHILQTTYNSEAFAPDAKKIMVNIDEEEITKLKCDIDLPIVADVGQVIREMTDQYQDTGKDYSAWWEYCKRVRQQYPIVLPEYWKARENGYVDNYVFIDMLSEFMQSNDVMAPGASGQCSEITLQSFKTKWGQRIISSQGFGAMGFGIPSAIAACLASGKRTVCVDGDGGFQLNIQELETVRRLNLNIKFFVLNNQGYNSIRNTQRAYFDGNYVASTPESGMTIPDTQKIATAYNIAFYRIRDYENLGTIIGEVFEHPGPVICEAMINPNQQSQPKVMAHKMEDGSMRLRMEDMYPWLSEEELQSNMLERPNGRTD